MLIYLVTNCLSEAAGGAKHVVCGHIGPWPHGAPPETCGVTDTTLRTLEKTGFGRPVSGRANVLEVLEYLRKYEVFTPKDVDLPRHAAPEEITVKTQRAQYESLPRGPVPRGAAVEYVQI